MPVKMGEGSRDGGTITEVHTLDSNVEWKMPPYRQQLDDNDGAGPI
jgi:hypothetical protein